MKVAVKISLICAIIILSLAIFCSCSNSDETVYYTVTFLSDGSVIETKEIESGSIIIFPELPSKVGYSSAWDVSTFLKITEDREVNVVFTPKTYTIVYKVDGAEYTTRSFVYSEGIEPEVSIPEVPEKEGHTGVWDRNSFASLSDSVVVNAKYTKLRYTVKFEMGGGEPVPSVTADYGTEVNVNPVYAGYTFIGWCTDKELKNPYTLTTIPAEDLTLYARWRADDYSIILFSDGTIFDSFTAKYNNSLTFDRIPQKDGFVFAGWYMDEEYSEEAPDEYIVGGDAFIYARWVKNDSAAATSSRYFDFVLNADDTYTLSKYTAVDADEINDIVVPSVYNGKVVSAIGDSAFENAKFDSIIIPSSIITIGKSAFNGVVSLNSDLITVSVSFSGSSLLREIGACAFANSAVDSVELPSKLKALGNKAFYNCLSLNTFEFENPSRLEILGAKIWEDTPWYTELFGNATSGREITFGNVIYSIKGKLSPVYLVSNTVVGIAPEAFAGQTDLTSVNIGNSVKYIGVGSSEDGIKGAFYACSALKRVFVSANNVLETVGIGAYEGCNVLEEAVLTSDFKAALAFGETEFENSYSPLTGRFVPMTLKKVTLRGRATSLLERMFYNFKYLTDVALYDGLKVVGNYSLSGCEALRSLTFPLSVSEIGDYALLGSMKNGESGTEFVINIPRDNSLTIIGNFAFADLTNVNFNILDLKKLEEVKQYAFRNCVLLTDFIAPAIKRIGNYAFLGCGNLARLTVPVSNREDFHIGSYFSTSVFENSYKVDISEILDNFAYYLPNSLKTLYVTAVENECSEITFFSFGNCLSLTEVIIDEGITVIGKRAFADNSSLRQVTFASSVQAVKEEAFSNADLETVYFGRDGELKEIGERAFEYNSSLTELSFGKNVESFALSSLDFCLSFKKIVVSEENPYFYTDNGVLYSEQGYLLLYPRGNELTGYKVLDGTVAITANAFANNKFITELSLPSGLQKSGLMAFDNCTELKTVKNSTSLTLFDILNGSNVIIENIIFEVPSVPDDFAFGYGVKSVAFASENTIIGANAFSDCFRLTDIDLTNVTTVKDRAFAYSSEIESLTVAPTVTNIEKESFLNCSKLATVSLSANNSLIYIGERAFYGTLWLDNNTDAVLTLGKVVYTSKGYNGLNLALNVGVEYITAKAFKDSASITSISFPNTVTSIGDEAFRGLSSLAYVSFPSTLKSLGDYCFADCVKLSEINFTDIDALTEIGRGVFLNTAWFNSEADGEVFLSDGYLYTYKGVIDASYTVSENVRHIMSYAFQNQNGLYSLTLSTGLQSIGEHAFGNCTNLSNVYLPRNSTITEIKDYAFENCISLTGFEIPRRVTEINPTVFDGCLYLENVSVENGNTAFYYENVSQRILYNIDRTEIVYVPLGINGEIVLPDGLRIIPQNAFTDISGLTSVHIPASVVSVGDYAFKNCENISNVDIAENSQMEYVGREAFANTSVSSMVFPSSVNKVGFAALGNCDNLQYISFLSDTPPVLENTGYSFNGKIFVNRSVINLYRVYWQNYNFNICKSFVRASFYVEGKEYRVVEIGYGETVTDVPQVPTKVGYNSSWSVNDFSNLEEDVVVNAEYSIITYKVTLMKNETEVYKTVDFTYGASVLNIQRSEILLDDTNVKLFNGWTTDVDGRNMFALETMPASDITLYPSWCTFGFTLISGNDYRLHSSLNARGNISLPSYFYLEGARKEVIEIGNDVFMNNKNIRRVTVPSSYTKIGNSAFKNSSVTEIVFDDAGNSALTEITSQAFYGSQIENIVLPDSVTVIHDNAFYKCVKLTDFIMPSDLISIGENAFYECIGLTNVSFDKVSGGSVGNSAFYGCSKLSYLDNTLAITALGTGAFKNCSSLASFEISSLLTTLPEEGFYGTGLKTVTVPATVTVIETGCFASSALSKIVFETDENEAMLNIKSLAFNSCVNLNNVILPLRLNNIENGALTSCPNLMNVILLPDRAETVNFEKEAFPYTAGLFVKNNYLGEYLSAWTDRKIYGYTYVGEDFVFNGNNGTVLRYLGDEEELSLPTKLNRILIKSFDALTFNTANKLVSLSIPTSISHMFNGEMFINCRSLEKFVTSSAVDGVLYSSDKTEIIAYPVGRKNTSFTILSSVTKLGDYSFYNLEYLINLICEGAIPPTIEENTFGNLNDRFKIFVNKDGYARYQEAWVSYYERITGEYLRDGDYMVVNVTGGVEISQYVGNETNISLPYALAGKKVVGIGGYSFYNSSIRSIVFAANIEYISEYAFANSEKLASVVFQSGVKTIAQYAFYNCSIVSLNFATGTALTEIGQYAFAENKSLKTVTLSSFVASVGNSAFENCVSLESLVFVKSSVNTVINEKAFYNCSSLSSVVWQNSGVTEIANEAFYGNSSLTEIALPSTLKSIGENAFVGCSSLNYLIFDSGSHLTSIGNSAFENLTNLRSLTLPASVITVGSYAFYNTNITALSFESDSSLNNIGEFAFASSNFIRQISLPASVKTIGEGAFSSSLILNRVIFEGSVPPTVFDDSFDKSVRFYVNNDFVSLYKRHLPIYANNIISLKNMSDIYSYIPYGNGYEITQYLGSTAETIEIPSEINGLPVLSIGSYSFGYTVRSVIIPSTVVEIKDAAFYLSAITQITLPSSVKTIEGNPFISCVNLENFSVEAGNEFFVTENGMLLSKSKDRVISYANKYSDEVVVPNTVTEIIKNAFNGCDNLVSISVPSSVTDIGDYAFRNCEKLRYVSFVNSLTLDRAGEDIFGNTAWLDDIGEGIIYIDKVVYAYNGKIAEDFTISISDNSEKILPNAFKGQSALTDLVIPNSVTEIGENVLQGCSSLVSITLGGNIRLGKYFGTVSYEDSYAAYSSIDNVYYYIPSKLQKVTLAPRADKICDYMFENCAVLTTAIICDTVKTIGKYAFAGTAENVNMDLNNLEFSLGALSVIGAYAFKGCTKITNLTIPYTVTKILTGAFGGTAQNPMSIINLDFGKSSSVLEYIGANAFSYIPGLSELTMPDSLSYIGPGAFAENARLSKVVFAASSSLKTLEDKAFYNCINLDDFSISASISYIGDYVFYNCTSLKKITFRGLSNLRYVGYKAFESTPYYLTTTRDFDGIFYIGKVAYEYLGSLPTSGKISLQDGTLALSPYIFSNYEALTHVVMYDTANGTTNAISDGGSATHRSIVTLELGDDLETIGDYAFALIPDGSNFTIDRTKSLSEVILPQSVKNVGQGAFMNNIALDYLSFANAYHCDNSFQNHTTVNYLLSLLEGNKNDNDPTNDGITLDETTKIIIDKFNNYGFDLIIARLGALDTAESIIEKTNEILAGLNFTNVVLSAENKSNISKLVSLDKQAFENTEFFNRLTANAADNSVIYIENVAYGYKGTIADNTELTFKEDTVAVAENGYTSIEKIDQVLVPIDVTYETDFAMVSAGNNHSLGIDKDGKLWVWGNNTFGQLGDGTKTASAYAKKLSIENTFIDVSAGEKHSLAIDSAGRIWAWGDNEFGQLGRGNYNTSVNPVRLEIRNSPVFTKVFAGNKFSVALDRNGKLWTWGANDKGQLGNGSTTSINLPVLVNTQQSFIDVSVGYDFALAIDDTNRLWGWGTNTQFQIAQTSRTNYLTPCIIMENRQFIKIAAGESHALGIDVEKKVWGWGSNVFGQVGETTATEIATPIIIMPLQNYTASDISCGRNFSAIIEDRLIQGSSQIKKILWCFGANFQGQLGTGDLNSRPTPAEIDEDIVMIEAGGSHCLAFKRVSGVDKLYAWGYNEEGQLSAVIRTTYDIKNNDGLISVSLNEYVSVVNAGAFDSKNGSSLHTVFVQTGDSENCDLSGLLLNSGNLKIILADTDLVAKDFNVTDEMLKNVKNGIKIYVYGVNRPSFINADGWSEISENIYSYDNIFGDYIMSYSEEGWEIIYYFGSATAVNVPSDIDGEPVTKIGPYAFNTKVTSVVVPENIKIIDSYAFAKCVSLQSITLPSSLKTIGDYAFIDCKALINVTIPANTVSIGKYAFANCSSLNAVDLSECLMLETIDDYAFLSCSSLTALDVPETLTYIGNYALADCDKFLTLILRGAPPEMGGTGIYDEPRMTIYVTDVELYRNHSKWFIYTNRFDLIGNNP